MDKSKAKLAKSKFGVTDLEQLSAGLPVTEAPDSNGGTPAEKDLRARLVEREDAAHPLLIYTTKYGVEVALPYTDQTLWADQQQISDMFSETAPMSQSI